jgi:uncharacterized Fe-S cluster-containing radical SAM superfamily protein
MRRAVFRDPTPGGDAAPALRLELASALLGVAAVPSDLPEHRLTLLDVEGSRSGVGLILGKSDPIGRIRIQSRRNVGGLVQPLLGRSFVDIDVEPMISELGRFQADFEGLAKKLRTTVTAEMWAGLMEPARRLGALPSSVPMAYFRQIVPGAATAQGLVRTGFNCNQDCGICWQGRDWGRYEGSQTLTWIEDLAKAGARTLNISGGEPTLDGRLEEYIRHARSLGFHAVTLETNAIQFARRDLAPTLRDAGLTDCFVSLHSGDPAISDAITRAPGTHAKTVQGIQALLTAGVPVQLNSVMTRDGLESVGDLPDFIHDTFGQHPKLRGLMLSQPAQPYDLALLPSILPEPARVRTVLRRTIDRAFAVGLRLIGLEGAGGPPLCAFGADPRLVSLRPVTERLTERVWLTACDQCVVRHACFGVRIGDVKAFGDACVEPILTPPTRPTPAAVT